MSSTLYMLDEADVVERLKATVPELRKVDLLESLAEAQSVPTYTPCAYVLVGNESPSPSDFEATKIHQLVTTTLAVVLAISMRPHPGGQGGARELREMKLRVLQSIYGWTPPNMDRGLELSSGDLTGYTSGIAWWEYVFNTSSQFRTGG